MNTSLGHFPSLIRWVTLVICLLPGLGNQALADLVKLETESGFHSVYVFEEPDAEEVRVSLTVLAGEVDVLGPEGLSHYLEHLMFWHADKVNDEPFHARGGNAWVNGIVTNYFNVGGRSELEDMFEFVRRLFSEPELDLRFMLGERDVVEREYDLRYSENPDVRVLTQLRKKLYSGAAVSRSTIGTPASIASLTVEQARAFHRKFYHPANSVLFVGGDITALEVQSLIAEKLATIPPGDKHAADWRNTQISGELDLEMAVSDNFASYERAIYGSLGKWSSGKGRQHDDYTAGMLSSILNSALPGSLAGPLRLDSFIVSSYELYLYGLLSGQYELLVFAQPDEGVELKQMVKALRSTIKTLGKEGIPAKTLERVRKRMLQTAKRESRFEDVAYWRSQIQLTLGIEPVNSTVHMERIAAVTLDDVNSLLAAVANSMRQVTALIQPVGD